MWTTLVTAVSEAGRDIMFYRFLSRMEAEGVRIIQAGVKADDIRGFIRQELLKEESLLLTDVVDAARIAMEAGMAAVCYEHGSVQSCSGVPYILQGLDGVEREYLQMVYSRYHGEPLVIAKTEHLCIRELVCGEAEDFFSLCGEAGLKSGMLPADQREFVQAYRKCQYSLYGYGFWSLIERESGKWAGIAGAEGREDEQGCYLELGYAIVSDKRQRGYAKEACMAVLEYFKKMFEEEDRCKIKCFVPKGNIASQRTAQSIGMLQTKEVFDKFYCYERIL